MVKLLVFAILLASSPATGLLETLFRTENNCYSGCQTNYAANPANHEACKKGCNYKLYNEDCATKCKSFSVVEQIQASCQVGCTLSRPVEPTKQEKPSVEADVDPALLPQEPPTVVDSQEPERPRSFIIVRLRQRPAFPMPAFDPAQMFNDILRQFRERTNEIDQSIRQSFDRPQDLPKPGDMSPVIHLIKNIPIVPLPNNIRADSSSESSEEQSNNNRPLIDEFKHIIKHPREQQQRFHERMQPLNARIRQFFEDVRTEWNDFVRKQPKVPIWIFICILLSSSAILWYMAMSLCRHRPSREALSIRSQDLVFHPYDYEAYEKEKIQPDDQHYEVTESFPIKVKLSNI